jgi:hypothetical protein
VFAAPPVLDAPPLLGVPPVLDAPPLVAPPSLVAPPEDVAPPLLPPDESLLQLARPSAKVMVDSAERTRKVFMVLRAYGVLSRLGSGKPLHTKKRFEGWLTNQGRHVSSGLEIRL